MYSRGTQFTQDARAALSHEKPDVELLQKLLVLGSSLDLDVPEVKDLEQAIAQQQWLEEVSVCAVVIVIHTLPISLLYCLKMSQFAF